MLTKRQWLAERGLAKADGRGRFSSTAIAALDKAVEDGTTFAEPVIKTTPKAAEITQPYDVKKVRVWAGRNGINVGLRGRIPAEVILAYLAANPAESVETPEPVEDEVTTPRVVMGTANTTPAPAIRILPVRNETVAYGRAPRKPGDSESVTEPVVAIQNCGKCGGQVAYCKCDGGPRMPQYLGGEIASLTKPE